MKAKKQIKKIQSMMFKGVFLTNMLLFSVVLLMIGSIVYNNIIHTVGDIRTDLLKQISDKSTTVNKSASYVSSNLYNRLVYHLLKNEHVTNHALTEQINQVFHEDEKAFEAIDIQLSLMVIMKNGFEYVSETVTQEDVKSIKSSFWYIDNFTNDKNNLWITRFGRFSNRANMEISYVKVLRDSNKAYQGVIIISSLERDVYDVYADILEEDNQIYIVDKNGIIISHKNKDLIGVQKFYMKTFFNDYEKNNFTIRRIADEKVLYTNHHDPETGWTIIEEYKLSKVLYSNRNSIIVGGLAFLLSIGISLLTSFYNARRISRPIVKFSNELERSSTTSIQSLELQNEYYEIYSMTVVFNGLMQRIRDLIDKIKMEEQQKRKIELDFLQAQINPHLLHNTLFSIKCLIQLEKNEKAVAMLDSFMKLLKAPIDADKQLIKLKNEIAYLQDYITLMKIRYDYHIRMEVTIEDGLDDLLVPKMMLQPIVENSIFHGFGDMNDDGIIEVMVNKKDDDIIIAVKDNGTGLSKRELETIWNREENSKTSFNRIGLKNIRERIKMLYNERSSIEIHSELKVGTEVILTLSKGACVREKNCNR